MDAMNYCIMRSQKVKVKRTAALTDENRFLRAQLTGTAAGLTADQQLRLQYKTSETQSRTEASQLQAAQLERQLAQAEVQRSTAAETLTTNQSVLEKVKPLADQGAISQLQYLKQKQEVSANQSEVQQLAQEQQRLALAVQEVKAKTLNSDANDGKDILAQLALNEQKIAEIETQFTKAILENKKRIAEIDSQIQQSQQLLKYGEILAPVDGVVFDLKPKTPGYVTNVTEPLLKIVPQGTLIAQVSITNQDIGFVKPGMTVDVRIDSFPFSEFGDVKGELIWIGSDAAQPTQSQPFYTFPAKIRLQQQQLQVQGKPIALQSGMSLSANIQTRKRKVIDVFTEQFKKGMESLKFVR
jgi:hemolysin D